MSLVRKLVLTGLCMCVVACAGVAPASTIGETNKALVRQWIQDVDAAKGALTVVDKWMSPDFKLHLNGGAPMDLAAYKSMIGSVMGAFSNMTHEIQSMVAEGDRVFIGMTIRGTHTGEYQGIKATGRQISIVEAINMRFVNGKIAEEWAVVDLGTLQQQLTAPK